MANFKVGDRVRILVGARIWREGTITEALTNHSLTDTLLGYERIIYPPIFYRVTVDGIGDRTASGRRIAYEPQHLAPLTPPAEDTWAADAVKRVTKPQHVEPVAPKEVPVAMVEWRGDGPDGGWWVRD